MRLFDLFENEEPSDDELFGASKYNIAEIVKLLIAIGRYYNNSYDAELVLDDADVILDAADDFQKRGMIAGANRLLDVNQSSVMGYLTAMFREKLDIDINKMFKEYATDMYESAEPSDDELFGDDIDPNLKIIKIIDDQISFNKSQLRILGIIRNYGTPENPVDSAEDLLNLPDGVINDDDLVLIRQRQNNISRLEEYRRAFKRSLRDGVALWSKDAALPYSPTYSYRSIAVLLMADAYEMGIDLSDYAKHISEEAEPNDDELFGQPSEEIQRRERLAKGITTLLSRYEDGDYDWISDIAADAWHLVELTGHKRIPQLEEIIAQDPRTAYRYAEYILGSQRFELGEPAISQDHDWGRAYASNILDGKRWKKYEAFVLQDKDPEAAFLYARDIMHFRWPEAEPFIAHDALIADEYDQHFNTDIQHLKESSEPSDDDLFGTEDIQLQTRAITVLDTLITNVDSLVQQELNDVGVNSIDELEAWDNEAHEDAYDEIQADLRAKRYYQFFRQEFMKSDVHGLVAWHNEFVVSDEGNAAADMLNYMFSEKYGMDLDDYYKQLNESAEPSDDELFGEMKYDHRKIGKVVTSLANYYIENKDDEGMGDETEDANTLLVAGQNFTNQGMLAGIQALGFMESLAAWDQLETDLAHDLDIDLGEMIDAYTSAG